MIRRVEGLLLEPEDCLALDRIVMRGIKDAIQRDGGVSARTQEAAAQLHRCAVEFRESQFRVIPQASPDFETTFDHPGFASRSSEATEWLSVREAAQLSDLSEQFIRRLAHKRVLNGDQLGHRGAWRLDRNSVAVWIAARKGDQQAA